MKIFMIFLLLQIGISFKFKQRPSIQKEECPVKLGDLKYDLIFFSKLEAVDKYKPRIDELDILQQKLAHLLDLIREPNSKLLDIITQSKIQTNVLYVIDYEENKQPEDLQAIKYYNTLREFAKEYSSTLTSIFEGTFFLNFFEKDVKKFQDSVDKSKKIINNLSQYSIEDIQKELEQLQRDFQICKGSRFHLIQQSIDFEDKKIITKTQKAHKKKSSHNNKKRIQKNHKKNKDALQLIQWQYVDYEPVKINECDKYIQEIEEDFLEFLKIWELVRYKRSQSEYRDVVHFLFQNKEEYIKNANIISKAKSTVNLNNQLLQGGNLKYYVGLGSENQFSGYNRDYKFANDAIMQLDQTYSDLDAIIRLFHKSIGIGLETFQFFKQKTEVLNDYLDKHFSYQEEEVYHELLQIDRDYKICEGKKHYKIFKLQNEIKPKQIDEKKKEIILSPPIEKQNCEKQITNIKENILYYLKLNVVKQFGLLINYYEQIMNDITEQQKNIINNNKQMNNWLEDLQLDSKLVFIQYILSNSNPDDVEAIKAYDNLDKLNNRLTYLKKDYQDAKAFLKLTDQDFQSLNEQFAQLKKQIDYSKYQDLDIQKALLESLRDYNVCTQKDFITEFNLQIEDKSRDNFSYSQYKDKNKFIKPINILIQQNTVLIQTNYEWKYYEYAPIQKHECQEELPMIREDILQFQKIKALHKYQTNNQKSYDILIEKILNFEQDFLMNTERGIKIMRKFDFTKRLRFFNDYPKNTKQVSNPEILIVFDKIHEYINKLGSFDQQLSATIWLYDFQKRDFETIEQAQLILNDYLNKRFNYKINEVEMELNQLYRDYQICTGKSYFDKGTPNIGAKHHPNSKSRGIPIADSPGQTFTTSRQINDHGTHVTRSEIVMTKNRHLQKNSSKHKLKSKQINHHQSQNRIK